jgi:hypothetical protein
MAATLVTRELDGQHDGDERSAALSPGRGGSGMRANALSQTAPGFAIRMTISGALLSESVEN